MSERKVLGWRVQVLFRDRWENVKHRNPDDGEFKSQTVQVANEYLRYMAERFPNDAYRMKPIYAKAKPKAPKPDKLEQET